MFLNTLVSCFFYPDERELDNKVYLHLIKCIFKVMFKKVKVEINIIDKIHIHTH